MGNENDIGSKAEELSRLYNQACRTSSIYSDGGEKMGAEIASSRADEIASEYRRLTGYSVHDHKAKK